MIRLHRFGSALLVALALFAVTAAAPLYAGEGIPVSGLRQITHIHGIAVDGRDPSRLYVATHHGFFVVSSDGIATRVSEVSDDFMGFTPHPTDPGILYGSGHPARGGNVGFIMSSDGGRSWRQLSKGANGPVDFHQMDVSKADPNVIYGVYDGLQVSRDGGRSWSIVGPAPDGLLDLATSSRDVNTVFAATRNGLLLSRDGGRTWQDAYVIKRAASMVETGRDGSVYAFISGVGLIRTTEPGLNWTPLSRDFGDRFILHLALHPIDANKLYAVTQHSEVIASTDGGRGWRMFGTGEPFPQLGQRTQ